MNQYTRPPLGLRPKCAYIGDRMIEIREAIQRYAECFCEIPQEWITEYNELAKELQK